MEINFLILERPSYEEILMNYLTSSIPDDFWEPVKIKLNEKEISNLKNINTDDDCIICTQTKNIFKELNCCNQKLCNECCIKWFNESANCPYCKQDLRTYLNK